MNPPSNFSLSTVVLIFAQSIWKPISVGLTQPETGYQSDRASQQRHCGRRVRQLRRSARTRHHIRNLGGQKSRRRAHGSPPDVHGKTVSRAAQMRRVNSGQVIPPQTVQSIEEQTGQENTKLDKPQAVHCREEIKPRKYGERRQKENP